MTEQHRPTTRFIEAAVRRALLRTAQKNVAELTSPEAVHRLLTELREEGLEVKEARSR